MPESRRRQTTSAEPGSVEPASADAQSADAQSADAQSADAQSADAQSADPRDEMKRRFREALDRKHNREAEAGASGDDKDPSKIHGAHGPAASRRAFRRKSG